MQVGGRRQDSGDGGGNLCLWKGGGWDVLSCNVLLRIESKVLVDKQVLGGCGEEVLLLVFLVLRLVESDVGKSVKAGGRSRGDGGTGDDVGGAIRDVEERVVFDVVKSGPDKLGGWGTWDRDDRW